MPRVIEIVSNISSQTFDITLEGRLISFHAKWNTRLNSWSLNLSENGTKLIDGIVLKLGVNLLTPFNFKIGDLFVIDTTNTGREMSLTNVGSEAFLIHLTEDELNG